MIVVIITLVLLVLFTGYNIIIKILYPIKYSDYVSKYSDEYGVEDKWIYALIKAESNYNSGSVSSMGAIRTYAGNE